MYSLLASLYSFLTSKFVGTGDSSSFLISYFPSQSFILSYYHFFSLFTLHSSLFTLHFLHSLLTTHYSLFPKIQLQQLPRRLVRTDFAFGQLRFLLKKDGLDIRPVIEIIVQLPVDVIDHNLPGL